MASDQRRTAPQRPRRVKIVAPRDLPIDKNDIRKLIKKFLLSKGVRRWDIVVYFMPDDEIVEVNKVVFSRDYPTDVITVPIEEDPLEGEIFLGIEEIKRNSRRYGTDFVWELKFCLLHGLLHLLGWEDDTEEKRKKMFEQQARFLEEYESGISPQ